VCCGVLQGLLHRVPVCVAVRVAVCCSVRVKMQERSRRSCCSVLRCVLQCGAARVAVCCSVLCIVLQCVSPTAGARAYAPGQKKKNLQRHSIAEFTTSHDYSVDF